MRDVRAHIERCISKSGRLMVAEDILDLRGLIVGGNADGSATWSYRPEGKTMHIYHVYGDWCANVDQFTAEIRRDMFRHRCTRFAWNGRKGWERFLKARGWLQW